VAFARVVSLALCLSAAVSAGVGDAYANRGRPATRGEKRAKQRHVVVVRLIDRTAKVARRLLLRRLERAFRRHRGFRLVTRRRVVKTARRLRIPRRRIWRQRSLRRLAKRLRFELTIRAVLERHGVAYRFRLLASSVPKDFVLVGAASLRMRRLRLPLRTIARAVQRLRHDLDSKLRVPRWATDAASGSTADSQRSSRPAKKPASGAPSTSDPNAAASSPPASSTAASPQPAATPKSDDSWNTGGFAPLEVKTPRAALKVKLGGRIAVEHHSYFRDLEQQSVAGRNEAELSFEVRAGTETFFGFGRLIARYDFSDETRNRLDPDEAYVQARFGRFAFRAGRIVESWGAASMLNPVDVLNPVDYLDLWDRQKRGAWMTRLSLLLGPVELSAYFLPVFMGHILPPLTGIANDGSPQGSSRWLPRTLPLPITPSRVLIERSQPKARAKNFQAALRVAASFAGIDLALSYAYLFDRMPNVQLAQTTQSNETTLTVTFAHHRVHTIGLELETAIGGLHLAAEALGVITENIDGQMPSIQRPYVQVVAGADYRTSEFFGNHRLQLFVEIVTAQPIVGELFDDGLRFPVVNGILGRVRYQVGQHIRFDVNVMSALDCFDIAIEPQLELVLYDKIVLQLGGLWLQGGAEGFFGHYRRNSRVRARVELSF
jgi:hypothetical protein